MDDVLPVPPLAPREYELLRLLATGVPLKTAARRMGVSYHTANNYRLRAYERIGATGLQEALVLSGIMRLTDVCGAVMRCGRPAGHKGHHGGFRPLPPPDPAPRAPEAVPAPPPPPATLPDGAMTATEVAKALGIHINTLKRIGPSDLPFVRVTSRGDRRYRREDVLAYLGRTSRA